MRTFRTVLVLALSMSCGGRTTEIVSDTQALDDGRRWLDPRAVPAPTAPALLRAAVANARNQTSISESLLLDILRTQPASESARGAHELLSRIYLRSGQYRRLIANFDEWARDFPNGEDVRKERADVEQFRGLPDQISGEPARVTLPHEESNDFSAPLTINGLPATYLLDTGAWMSIMTEAEAKRFGMTIRSTTSVVGESSGKGVSLRMAVAQDLVLGGMTFHDVSFGVLPDGGSRGARFRSDIKASSAFRFFCPRVASVGRKAGRGSWDASPTDSQRAANWCSTKTRRSSRPRCSTSRYS